MSNKDKNYENIENPYDADMIRRSDSTAKTTDVSHPKEINDSPTSEGSREGSVEINEIRLTNKLESRNYLPGITGFTLDSRTGRAFFSRIEVNNRSDEPAITVRKLEGKGVALTLESYGDTALMVRQQSNTPAAKFFTTSLDGSEGATVEATNEASDAPAGSFKQNGTGNVLYLQKLNPETGETDFYPVVLMSGGDFDNLIKLWIGNGSTPHGDLNGEIGDVLFDKGGSLFLCKGGQTWRNLDDSMELLANVSLGSAASYIDSGIFHARSLLRVEIHLTDPLGGATIPKMRFNGDSANNYGFSLTEITGTSDNNNATGVDLYKNNASSGASFSYTICNNAAEYKIVTGTGFKQNNVHVFGGGTWKNTADQITSVQVDGSGSNLNVGSRLVVYGSNF
jgi:hypothetical protein